MNHRLRCCDWLVPGISTLLMACAVAAIASPATAAAPVASPALATSAASASGSPHSMGLRADPRKPQPGPTWLVDINSASLKDLKTLPGIGDPEADRIIANRPYLTKTELVSKNVLPMGSYLSLKKKIVAMQKFKPAAQAPAKAKS